MQLLATLLILLSLLNVSYAADVTQKTYTPQTGTKLMHFCSKAKDAGPELVCMKNFINQVFKFGTEPMTDYEFIRVYGADKVITLSKTGPKFITLTINQDTINKEKERITSYRNKANNTAATTTAPTN